MLRRGLTSPEKNPVDEPKHILVVDDDRRIRELIKSYLMENGFLVTVAGSAVEARERMRGIVFDLIVLDIMMPGETGLKFTETLRAGSEDIPVLMLSALADTDDRIAGLTTGSDDYLVKPFEPRELLLRIKNLLRRAKVAQPAAITDVRFGAFNFNVTRGELRKNGDLIKLTSGEKDLLRQLANKSGEPLSRLELSQPGAEDSARSVDVQINRLRQKIENDPSNPIYLQTMRGAGYALFVDEELSG
jgi:two-component system, OmpR family, phosphate regulon response regulator OmpR